MVLLFELEVIFKFVRFFCRKEFVKEVVEFVMGVVEWFKSLMDVSDCLVVNVEVVWIFVVIGYDCKVVFYGW